MSRELSDLRMRRITSSWRVSGQMKKLLRLQRERLDQSGGHVKLTQLGKDCGTRSEQEIVDIGPGPSNDSGMVGHTPSLCSAQPWPRLGAGGCPRHVLNRKRMRWNQARDGQQVTTGALVASCSVLCVCMHVKV